MKKTKTVPKEHPPAWQSPLWKHHELILSMRRRRHSYPEIVAVLAAEHGVQISPQSLRGFVVRWDKRKSDRKPPLPSGWTEAKASEALPADTLDNAKKERPITEPEPENFRNLFPK